MFRCGFCNTNVGPGVSPVEVVTEVRKVTYPPRYKEGARQPYRDDDLIDPGGEGVERVRVVKSCKACLSSHPSLL